MRTYLHTIFATFILFACTNSSPSGLSRQFETMSTRALWTQQYISREPLELAFIEAELGARGETASSISFLGKRTGSAYGTQLYVRNGGSSNTMNCSDFSSGAAAQKFFLAAGGPFSDSHDLDRDGDGLACEWGSHIQSVTSQQVARQAVVRPRYTSGRCYVGPRGGTYTLTSSGSKNYNGC